MNAQFNLLSTYLVLYSDTAGKEVDHLVEEALVQLALHLLDKALDASTESERKMSSLYSGFTRACQSVVLLSRPTWIGTPPYRLSCRWWWIFPQGALCLKVKLTKQRLTNWQVDGWKKGLSKCPPRRPLLSSVLRTRCCEYMLHPSDSSQISGIYDLKKDRGLTKTNSV